MVYAVLWLYGLLIDHDSPANFVPVNGADNWLHLFLAIGMIGLGVALGRTLGSRSSRQTGFGDITASRSSTTRSNPDHRRRQPA